MNELEKKLKAEGDRALARFKKALMAYPFVILAVFFLGRWSTWLWSFALIAVTAFLLLSAAPAEAQKELLPLEKMMAEWADMKELARRGAEAQDIAMKGVHGGSWGSIAWHHGGRLAYFIFAFGTIFFGTGALIKWGARWFAPMLDEAQRVISAMDLHVSRHLDVATMAPEALAAAYYSAAIINAVVGLRILGSLAIAAYMAYGGNV